MIKTVLKKLFGCKHPFNSLTIQKKATIEQQDSDFDKYTYFFKCSCCGEELKISHVSFRHGVDGFLKQKS